MDEQGLPEIQAWERTVNAAWDRHLALLSAERIGQPGRVSQNGWPVNPPRRMRTIPGTNIQVEVADGPAGDVLLWVAGQFHRRVEPIDGGRPDDWGWDDRLIRGGSDISNHASATAVDLNALRHELGASGTFDGRQVREIHAILAEVDNVVRWGGDYSGRPDEMHFEINASPEEVARVAERLNPQAPPQATLSPAPVDERPETDTQPPPTTGPPPLAPLPTPGS